MTPEMIQKLRKSLIEHESYRKFPYLDSVGKITIGVGFNLTDRGIDDDWIQSQFIRDLNFFYDCLSRFPWFAELNDDRKIVLIDMAFMGWKKFLEFEKMIAALAKNDYQTASKEMLDSEWAEQVKGRATQLAQGMLTGVYEL